MEDKLSYSQDVLKAIAFVNDIGIATQFVEKTSGFVDGISIESGSLKVDKSANVGDLLHEAGHLAIIPANLRHYAGGDLDESFEVIFNVISGVDPEHAIMRAVLQASDVEATAWAWAAGKHLDIDEEDIIKNSSYDGDGESIRLMLRTKNYFGINGLNASGMTDAKQYPAMKKWAQPHIGFD